MKNKKVDYLKIVLIIMLVCSLTLYYFLFIKKDNKLSYNDLPNTVTNVVWYESNSLETIKFSTGNFEYSGEDLDLGLCERYDYDEKNHIINFNCDNYKMKLVSVSDYKLIMVISGDNMKPNVYTYYSSLDLVNYLIEHDIKNISNDDIKEIMEDNDFSISKKENTKLYKSIQVSKLSSINELSIDEYLDMKNSKEKNVVLLLNPNMSVDAYDFIPVFIEWKNHDKDYNFYYVNGLDLIINDLDLLENDEEFKDYLLGMHDGGILKFNDGKYDYYSVDIKIEDNEEIFNCNLEDCFDNDITIYNEEIKYNGIENVLKEE